MPPDYLIARQQAGQHYDAAFHLLKVTMPVVNDPKLLIGVVHHLFLSMEACMDAILAYDRQLQLVPQYSSAFEGKFGVFRSRSARRHKIPTEIVQALEMLQEVVELHKESPMEFQRGNKMVLSTSSYQLKVLSLPEIKQYLELSRDFLHLTDTVLTAHSHRKE